MTDGTLIDDENGKRLVFERHLPHSRTRVWQALVNPEQRAKWFFAGTLDPVADGRVDLKDHGQGITGRVTAVENETLLSFTWNSVDGPNSTVSFQLSDAGNGSTHLVFTHCVNDDCRPMNLLPGWHAIFDDLGLYLEADTVAEQTGRHARLREHYLTTLGQASS
ncbi:Activator of Hsp90 ATPase 1 family protein [Kribbella flavida DSM 17836]|uniref:Activator of Hsp90 ATPase 1 family protein n=1 Tax=Kribbella flavida (strain DSM 17836 / JCM 10339 / NBRC 14399) TaxID=479435 RepID=D2PTW0_KRIFD|nr:SRPBCC domain-containing protein [Kribbella flavida]ADB33243.1 Activator of Hsp90 ATPase 1 family protein [Kribbella flavida DSM 17836]